MTHQLIAPTTQRLFGVMAIAVAALGPVRAESLHLPLYSITDPGTLGGEMSAAAGLNNSGQVVGWSTTASGETHAFLYCDGSLTDLGTLPGGTFSAAAAIDEAGRVVGSSGIHVVGRSGTRDGSLSRAFLWKNGAMCDLNGPISALKGWVFTSATGINDSGQIAGVGLHHGHVRAFLLTPVLPH